MTSPHIGIVVPVHNCLEYTAAALETIRTRYAYQVYVIDDRSDATTKYWLKERRDIITFTDPQGSTGLSWNWNLGISAALLDGCTHVLVINNDILLHPASIDNLVDRLNRGDVLLVTGDDIREKCSGPDDVFTWSPTQTGDGKHPDFSCFMLCADAIRHVGWFDEGFLGAYYEDNDYYARILKSGQKVARVYNAPYFHYSMRTISSNPEIQPRIQQRIAHNATYFQRKWGRLPSNAPDEILSQYYAFPFNRSSERNRDTPTLRLEQLFRDAKETPSDINQHLDLLYQLASSVQTIAEVGTGLAQATCAFASARPSSLRVYEPGRTAAGIRVEMAAHMAGVDFQRILQEGEDLRVEPADLFFIDGRHDKERITIELEKCAPAAQRFLIFHDTETFGDRGETVGHHGIWPAIAAYMRLHPEWRLQMHRVHDHGLTVFERFK